MLKFCLDYSFFFILRFQCETNLFPLQPIGLASSSPPPGTEAWVGGWGLDGRFPSEVSFLCTSWCFLNLWKHWQEWANTFLLTKHPANIWTATKRINNCVPLHDGHIFKLLCNSSKELGATCITQHQHQHYTFSAPILKRPERSFTNRNLFDHRRPHPGPLHCPVRSQKPFCFELDPHQIGRWNQRLRLITNIIMTISEHHDPLKDNFSDSSNHPNGGTTG